MNGPKIEVLQYSNNMFTISDKGNDFHGRAATGTKEGVDFIDTVYKASPGAEAGGAVRGVIDYGCFR